MRSELFMSERSHLTQPAYKFYIDQAAALGNAADFIAMKVEARDTMSSQYQAMLIWQQTYWIFTATIQIYVRLYMPICAG